jgi:GT2 family glycosyltransferase
MDNSISFCIASAKNEKEYTKLLIRSLIENTKIENHEILVFIDSDNQNTYEDLLEIKQSLSNIKIYRNNTSMPIGSQRNVSLMFDAATKHIVCYLQSDMVVGKNFDKHILKNMINKDMVLTCSRIEPPLHPASPEKIIKDFGVTPESFQYEKFQEFTLELQKENKPNMEGHFAPFVVYKETWFEKLGGFDTHFRCSREDSDMIIRMGLAGLNMVQTWDASVYHFTCVSSRGKNWFKPESDRTVEQKNLLQQIADHQELKKFIRKWGFFGHKAKPIFDLGIYIDIDQFVDFGLLQFLETYCKVLYLNNSLIANELKRRVVFDTEYYANLRWNYSDEHWKSVRHLFNMTELDNHIEYLSDKISQHDIIITTKYSDLAYGFGKERAAFIQNIYDWIDKHNPGLYNVDVFQIEIKNKTNLAQQYTKIKNNDLLLNSKAFVFE